MATLDKVAHLAESSMTTGNTDIKAQGVKT